MKKTLILLAALLAFAACKPVEVEVIKEVEVEKIVDILSLNAAQLRVPNSAVEQPLSFTTTDAWTISSDVDWITFDKTSGNSGSSNVTMKVAANSAYDTRTGRVTLSTSRDGTAKNTVFTVVQSETEVFNTAVECRVDYTEQDIAVDFNSNLTPEVAIVEGAEWLTITQTKAAPVDGKIVVHVALNEELDSRVGSFTVAAGSSIQTYNVMQASQYAAASSATALFLGNKQDMYDSENWAFRQFAQYAVQFATAEGDVTLVLNVDPEAESFTKIPAGEYKMDDSGTYVPGTYSVVIPEGKYVTTVVSDGKAMDVVDGTITVEDKGSSTAIVAELVDVAGTSHLYSYTGELVAEDASFGVLSEQPSFNNNYNTYFATGANEWKQSLRINKAAAEGLPWITGLYMTFYGPAGELADHSVPAGVYTYSGAEPETVETGYAKGNLNAAPGTLVMSGNSANGGEISVPDGETFTVTVTKADDGTYTYVLKGKLRERIHALDEEGYWAYDEENNPIFDKDETFDVNITLPSVTVPASEDNSLVPILDGDAVFSYMLSFSSAYSVQYYGDVFGNGGNIVTFGWNPGTVNENYYVFLSADMGGDFEFVPTVRNRYSQQNLVEGTYTYSETVQEGKQTLLPGLYNGAASRNFVQNGYTGTYYYITGGSVTYQGGVFTFDLTGVNSKGESAHFTGSVASGINMMDGQYRNYQSRFTLKPYVVPAP